MKNESLHEISTLKLLYECHKGLEERFEDYVEHSRKYMQKLEERIVELEESRIPRIPAHPLDIHHDLW